MPPRILHIFENGIEKKRCSKCKQYLSLDNYIYKKDRYDKLANECNKCRKIRNKRRYNPNYTYTEVISDDNNGSEEEYKEQECEKEKNKNTEEKEI